MQMMIKWIAFIGLSIILCSSNFTKADDTTPEPTTQIAITTQSTPSTTTSSPERPNNQTQNDHLFNTLNVTRYCECDLTGNFCDLNCCCDQECDDASKKLFSKCLDDSSKYRLLDPRYCYSRDIIYRNNTNHILERMTNVGGLFCIYTDNTKQQSYLMDKKIIKNLDDLNALNLRPEFNWTLNAKANYDLTTPELVNTNQLNNNYKFGKEIFTLDLKKIDQSTKQISSLSKLTLPVSLAIRNGECNSYKPVYYLQKFDSYCYKRISNLQNECKSGSLFDVNSYNSMVIGNSAQLLQFCNQHNCDQKKIEQSGKTILYKDQVCYNAVTSISYLIVYNEVAGIKKVLAKFEYADLKQPPERLWIKHYLKFSVQFIHENLHNRPTNISRYSGNLGYQLEKPLIGRFLTKNRTISSAFKFVNLQNVNDRCNAKSVNEQTVLFGLNHRSGCLFDLNEIMMRIEIDEIQSNRMPWDDESICKQFNSEIYKIFQQQNTNITFQNQLSAYGKYNLTMLDTWTPMLKSKKFDALSTTNENNMKINCQLLKQVNYQFVYSMVADSREPQRKLISATQTQVSHSFELCRNSSFCTNQEIELSTSIQFIQMKREKRVRFADSPAFKLELPEDFFYPFI